MKILFIPTKILSSILNALTVAIVNWSFMVTITVLSSFLMAEKKPLGFRDVDVIIVILFILF